MVAMSSAAPRGGRSPTAEMIRRVSFLGGGSPRRPATRATAITVDIVALPTIPAAAPATSRDVRALMCDPSCTWGTNALCTALRKSCIAVRRAFMEHVETCVREAAGLADARRDPRRLDGDVAADPIIGEGSFGP
jgi:hypothetical protein